jgi:predicted DNA-binding transcriptional regulator AlpA
LVFDKSELAYVLRVSVHQIEDIKHSLPKPIAVLGRHSRWSRVEIEDWLAAGGRARK